jgi:transcriptional regulator with XRE-family HTH domain
MFGAKLKELRVSHGLTQIQLAHELDVSKQCVSNWENDNILPSIDMLVRISKYFYISCDYLLELDDHITLDITGLTSDQRAITQRLVKEFQHLNQ